MHMFSKLQALMPDGRHRMLYTVGTPPEVYEVHFNEIVDYDDSLLEIPDGILTGVRPTLLNQMGGNRLRPRQQHQKRHLVRTTEVLRPEQAWYNN